MRKKYRFFGKVVLAGALVLTLGLAGCGNSDVVETEPETEEAVVETETETAEAEIYDGIVQNLEVAPAEDGSLHLTWDETPDAVGYLVEIHDAEGELIDSFTVTEPEAEITVPENGSYRVFVMRILNIDGEEMTDIDSFAEIEFTVEADETTGAAAVTTTGQTNAAIEATTAAAANANTSGATNSGSGNGTQQTAAPIMPSVATDPTEVTVSGRDIAAANNSGSGNGNASTPTTAPTGGSNPSGNTNAGSGRTNTNTSGTTAAGNTSGGSATGNTGSGSSGNTGNAGSTPSGNTGTGGNTSGGSSNTGSGSGNTGSGNSGSGSGTGGSGGGSSTTPTTPAETQHVHTWVESQELVEEAWDETVCVADAWDEPIYESHQICRGCGMDFTSAGFSQSDIDAHCSQHMLNGEPSNYGSSRVLVGTVHHDAEYETIHHPAIYNPIYICSGCGARG